MKKILGISCEHDSGAVIIDETGEIIAASNEERYTRKKLFTGFPKQSILAALEMAKIRPEEIKDIAVASDMHIKAEDWDWDKFSIKREIVSCALKYNIFKKIFECDFVIAFLVHTSSYMVKREICRKIRDLGIIGNIRFVDHHLCHINSSIHTSGFKEALALSFDGQGDGYCSKIYLMKDSGRQKKLIYKNVFFKSLAYYYGYTTKILGFKPMEHEGKIMALAASGNPDKAFEIFNSRLFFDSIRGKFIKKGYYNLPEIEYIKEKLANFSRKDIAAGVQKHLETNIISYIRYFLKKNPVDRIVLSGGIFANVLLNQKISELPEIKEIHIHPNMGDGGLALGAAIEIAAELPCYSNKRIDNVFLGPSLTGDMEVLKSKYGLNEIEKDDILFHAADLLAQNKIIGLVEGRMEYGPRALCHRSILCNPFNHSINDILNKKLQRSEFMPFAPVVLSEDMTHYFEDVDKKKFAMEFMTITCNTKEIFQKQAPATNHIDNTARPQIVFKDTGRIYKILKYFKEITGYSILVNTSFNMHEEPIVNSIEDAISAFKKSGIDFLMIEGRLFY